MTLADFARSIGISPATARQWKKRGKIVEVEGGFELIAEAQREWLGIAGRDVSVTVDNRTAMGVIGNLVNPEVVTVASQWEDVTQPESVTTVASTVDSAQDSHGSEGADMPPESNRESCADIERDIVVTMPPKSVTPAVVVTREAFEALQEQIKALRARSDERDRVYWQSIDRQGDGLEQNSDELAALHDRVTALEASNESIRQDMLTLYREMRDRCGALETEVAFLRTRLGQPDAPVILSTSSHGPIDPPGPNWGA